MKALVVLTAMMFATTAFGKADFNGPYPKFASYTGNATCDSMKDAVHEHGAVVIYSSAYIYNLYVSTDDYCAGPDDGLKAVNVEASDGDCWLNVCEPGVKGD